MTDPWKPNPRCCWCGGPFIERALDSKSALACATDACFERQCAWKMVDRLGKLFYLPNPKLVELEEAIASQQYGAICIGGSRAGGKSLGLRRIAQRYARKYEDFTVLFLRRTFPELARNHGRFCSREADRLGAHYASYKWTEDNGSLIELGHCQDDLDFAKYIGAEGDMLVLDQAEAFTDQQVNELSASVGRIRRQGWRGLLLAGENPGGPLSAFVDELFISKTRDRIRYPDYDPNFYHFIPASLDDNPYIPESYVSFLAGLEPVKRNMYRFGDRSRFPGMFFPAFNASTHVQ